MNFGVTREQLLKSISHMRKSMCYYIGKICDCKFMDENTKFGQSECSGCPELYQVIALLNSMNDEQFDAIMNKEQVITAVDFVKDLNDSES